MNVATKSSRQIALVAIFSLPFLWGPTFAIVQRVIYDITPMTYLALRLSLAGGIFLLTSKAARRGTRILIRPQNRQERRFRQDAIITGMSLCGGYLFQTIGLLTTTTSKSAFLTSTTVVLTPLLTWLLGKDRITYNIILAVIVIIIGIFLMTQPFRGEGIVIGDVLTLGCAISWSFYIISLDWAMPRTLKLVANEHEASLMFTSSTIIVSALLFWIFLPMLETPHLNITPFSVTALFYTVIFTTCLTTYLQTHYQHQVSATVAAIIYMLEPVAVIFIAALVLAERIGLLELLGGSLILLGVIISQMKFSFRSSIVQGIIETSD